MTRRTREEQLAEAFVSLADTLVADYDVVELLHTLVVRSAEILGVADAGILLPADDGNLEVIASTSERSHLIGLLQLSSGEGPCVDAYATGHQVSVDDIAATSLRWPRFAARAGSLGYRSMYALPMRLRDRTIGSLNLFSDELGPADPRDMAAAQALADVATIGILQERALREADVARDQLQHALNSRVIIEQAKGVIAHTDGVDMEEAFRLLRARARNSGQMLSIVAHDVVESARRS
ncbi:GAF and ANTAR domain-containing protein [Herbiconiux sp. CPCC 205763]|uniref:GAF and ANTAR domain-containing protein n=1 Tax=Herbiconiux aconitum TaxID=2970913 RepID=A0ABT2GT20_9MICO|nr:GAF and ANTAR domain-containing protein [Herbiconiux aconitum]MCS5718712.1 GAF and ANTAR domain-containing protein [Herbiconiux aconitum]